MKNILKICLLILTVWPIIYIGIFAKIVFDMMVHGGFNNSLYMFHAGTILLSFVLLIFYGVDLYRNEKINGNPKMLWLLGFIFLSSFVMIVYWIKFIWHDK